MARIPKEVIDRLKHEVSVERLAESRGVKLKRVGEDLIGLCPFHDDHDPSLVITPAKNLWNCLGKCRRGGSPIDWVMVANGISFRHAVELLLHDLDPVAAAPAEPVKVSTVRRLVAPFERDADDREVLQQVVRFYHETLKQSPEALGYLEKRGLRSAEMVERFQLGFSNRTLGYRIPDKSRQAGEAMRSRLQRLGLVRESGHEHFAGSLIVPVFDEDGQVAEIYGRKITANLRKGTPLHLYLPGGHHGVWNVAALAASKEVILCEALLDALTFWCAGYRNVTASYGICGFTEEHLEALRRHGTERVLLAYDRDEAGERAAAELAQKLRAEGIGCSRIQFPWGMDANEYALKVEPAAKALEVVIRAAVWLGNGKGPRVVPEIELVPAPARSSSLNLAAKREDLADEEDVASPAAEADRSRFPLEGPGLPEAKTSPDPPVAVPLEASGAGVEPPRATTPEPGRPRVDVPVELRGEEVVLRLGERVYHVRDLPPGPSYDQLRVNVLVTREDQVEETGVHVERFDLYARPQRAAFAKEAAAELRLEEEVIKRDLGRVLLKLEELLEERARRPALPTETAVEMSEDAKEEALAWLRDPRLLERVLEDFARCGVVGEETNKLVGYLACVSRKLEEPLAVILQSSSAAGKSALMEAMLGFLPEEERVKYSAMTGQSLFYVREQALKHKVLAIVEEEGAQQASYALKLLQSEGELTIASTGKDPKSGRLETEVYHVEGPVMILLTTTAAEVDEELLNRCLVLTVDEEREQTRAIHRQQRERQTLEGLLARQSRAAILQRHRNAQRLLRPLLVTNPYARELTFLDDRTRTRRDHLKYLTLIRAVALLHQHQRPLKTVEHEGRTVEYIEATVEDLAVANRLAHEVLGRSLDELAPQTRKLLMLLEEMVRKECERLRIKRSSYRFRGRQVRESTGWGQTQLKIHLARLVELEYLALHHGGRGLRYEYELVYDGQGQDGRPFLTGLIDVSRLGYDANRSGVSAGWSGPEGGWSGTGRPVVGHRSGGGRVAGDGQAPHADGENPESEPSTPGNAHQGQRRRRFT